MAFWDWIWAMVAFFFWIMYLMIFFQCIFDVFRRDDIHGGMKALWLLILFWLPFLGILAYMITRPRATAQDVRMMAQADAAARAAAGVSTADELTKLAQLRDSGAISVPEYESLKAKLLA